MSKNESSKTTTQYTDRDLLGVDFSFSNCDTKYLTHGIHNYPARMPPQIPKYFFEYYLGSGDLTPGDTVWDPFGGSGTTALEAQLAGLESKINDLNPLACMISRAKTTQIDLDRYNRARQAFETGSLPNFESSVQEQIQEINAAYDSGINLDRIRPDVSQRWEWFPEPQLYQLAHLRDRIDAIEDKFGTEIARFFRIGLSITAREVSYQRPGEYKRYRLPEDERRSHSPEVLPIFEEALRENETQMEKYCDAITDPADVTVTNGDSQLANQIPKNSVDIVLTSPPYGDHKTTVAYGEFSLDPAVISMDVSRELMKEVDNMGLGGRSPNSEAVVDLASRSEALATALEKLEDRDGRNEDALSFFEDYFGVLSQVERVLRPGQPAIFVVANRTVSGVKIKTHRITMDLLSDLGFKEEQILPRSLPYKTLPSQNSPSNVVGETGELMTDEFIVVAKAESQ